MSKFECIMDNILFPEWAVGIHEYGLTECLTDEDISEYESFIEDVIEECTRMGYENIHIQVNYDDDRGFCHYPEFGLATQCYGCSVWGRKSLK